MAAQEGSVEGCQEGRPRRRGRPDRRDDLGHQGRRRRGQFGDRFRRPQRAVPGSGQDGRAGRAPASAPTSRRSRPPRSASFTVETAISDAIATIGENMSLRRAALLEVAQGVVSSYVHGAVIDDAGKMGVMVALESTGKADELAALGRQLAMHVAADQSAGARSVRPRSRNREARKGRAGRQVSPAGQAGERDREDRRVRPEDLSTRKSACWSRRSSMTTASRSPRRSRKPKARSARL